MNKNAMGVFSRIVKFQEEKNITLNGNESSLIFSIIAIMEENHLTENYLPFYDVGILSRKSGIDKTNISKIFNSLAKKHIVEKNQMERF